MRTTPDSNWNNKLLITLPIARTDKFNHTKFIYVGPIFSAVVQNRPMSIFLGRLFHVFSAVVQNRPMFFVFRPFPESGDVLLLWGRYKLPPNMTHALKLLGLFTLWNEWHEIVWWTVWVFSYSTTFMSTNWIEIPFKNKLWIFKVGN